MLLKAVPAVPPAEVNDCPPSMHAGAHHLRHCFALLRVCCGGLRAALPLIHRCRLKEWQPAKGAGNNASLLSSLQGLQLL